MNSMVFQCNNRTLTAPQVLAEDITYKNPDEPWVRFRIVLSNKEFLVISPAESGEAQLLWLLTQWHTVSLFEMLKVLSTVSDPTIKKICTEFVRDISG